MPDIIDLILFGTTVPSNSVDWKLGNVYRTIASPIGIQQIITEEILSGQAKACLFWNADLGQPNPDLIELVLDLPGHVWHAGLRLGMNGLPGLIDFVSPIWMLNRDPEPDIEASSWRLSLNACLICTEVMKQLGGIDTSFDSLDGAALEMGYRYIVCGAFVRYIPWLIPTQTATPKPRVTLNDEFRFIGYHFKRWQYLWSVARAVLTRYQSPFAVLRATTAVQGKSQHKRKIFEHQSHEQETLQSARITVLIPTLNRYPYLRTLLNQLRNQNLASSEIIVVDQTEESVRDTEIAQEFRDLPVTFIYQDKPGQCTSRNQGLQASSGDYILFLDDDDEIEPDLIHRHLEMLCNYDYNVSAGVANEIGAGTRPYSFTYARTSDVFPTNNSMIKREILSQSGLFDLAYERGQRADGDLGMRLYLSGQLMVLNPSIMVLHHHAPIGGLRAHKARAITYASSRGNIYHRHLPTVTEIYFAKRYYTPPPSARKYLAEGMGNVCYAWEKSK